MPAEKIQSVDEEPIQFDSSVRIVVDDDVCRVCLSSEGIVALFDGFGTDEQFRYCTSLQVSEDDGLPNKLCQICTDHLKISYDFRFQATYAEKYFRKNTSSSLLNGIEIKHDSINGDEKCNNSISLSAKELEENMNEIDQLLTDAEQNLDPKATTLKKDERPLSNPGSIFSFRSEYTSDDDALNENAFSSDSDTCEIKNEKISEVNEDSNENQNQSSERQVVHKKPTNPEAYDYYYSNNDEANQENQNNDATMETSMIIALPKHSVGDDNNVDKSKGTKEKTLKMIHIIQNSATKDNARKIECNICGRTFTHTNSLRQHLMKHTGEKPFKCEFCEKCFARKTVLTIHRRLHTGDRPYRCDECIRSFVTKEARNRHKQRDHDDVDEVENISENNSFVCLICHEARSSKNSLVAHMRTMHPKDGQKFGKSTQGKSKVVTKNKPRHPRRSARINGELTLKYCEICQQEFVSKSDLVAHQKRHDISQIFKCDLCERVFDKKYRLLYHLQTHANAEALLKKYAQASSKSRGLENTVSVDTENNKLTNDDDDDKPLAQYQKELRRSMRKSRRQQTRAAMTENVEKVASKGQKKCQITQSSKIQNSKIGSERPSKAASSTRASNIDYDCRAPRENLQALKSKLMCQLCRTTFTHPTSLKVHMIKHSGERPFKCQHCNKSFGRKNVLNIHLRLHTGERPYKCPVCKDAFITKEALARHVTKVHQKSSNSKEQVNSHNAEKEDAENVVFRCNLCEQIFSNLSEYSSHLDAHKPPEVFQCDFCDLKFEKKVKLIFHIQQHKVEKESCKKCGEVFKLKDELIRHVKRSHLDQRSVDYKCMDCNIGLFDMRDYKEHLFEQHGIFTQGLNTCDVCRLNFNSGKEYYEHIYDKHDKVNKPCNECGKSFKSLQNFNEHFFSHYMK